MAEVSYKALKQWGKIEYLSWLFLYIR